MMMLEPDTNAGTKTTNAASKTKRRYRHTTIANFEAAVNCYWRKVSKKQYQLARAFLWETWRGLLAKQREKRRFMSRLQRELWRTAPGPHYVCGRAREQIVPRCDDDLHDCVAYVASEILCGACPEKMFSDWFDRATNSFKFPVAAPGVLKDEEPETEEQRAEREEVVERCRRITDRSGKRRDFSDLNFD
jgi:hypothetical protein